MATGIIGLNAFLSEVLCDEMCERVSPRLDIFWRIRRDGVYSLAKSTDSVFYNNVLARLSNGHAANHIEIYFYSKIKEEFPAVLENSSDGSLREALLRLGELSQTATFFYPGAVFAHSGPKKQGRLQRASYHDFLNGNAPIVTGQGQEALYWHDALKILANYLDVAMAFNSDIKRSTQDFTEAETRLKKYELLMKIETVLDLLLHCVPLGFLQKDPYVPAVLFA